MLEKAPNRAFSWLKAPASAFTFKKLFTVLSSAECGIMCDKILSPDTLNVDMGDFV